MADRFDQDAPDAKLEARRVAYAAARIAEHADRELWLLTRATEAESDRLARELESAAHTAYQDFLALIEEHDLAN